MIQTQVSTVILFLFGIFGCSESYPEHPNYVLTGEQTDYRTWNDENGNTIREEFGVTFKLTAKSDSVNPIYLMTCSWGSFSTSNHPKLGLCSLCESNFMGWATVTTEQYLELHSSVCSIDNFDPTSTKFRVALIAIDTTEMDYGYYLINPNAENYLDSLIQQEHRYVWSNEIQLERGTQTEYFGGGGWKEVKISSNR